MLRMLSGTRLDPQEIVAVVPPDLVECTVEKVAINAVLAGCRPEYLPVVLAAVRAACTDAFNAHGVLATTMPVGPIVIVNGPVRRQIGMNSGINVLGQGNRANSTIGRALQLVIRNVGGGRPGGVDRAAHGNPGKVGLCFAEDEEGSPWEPFHVSQGFAAGTSTVTLFAGEGSRGVVDQLSREPESLARSFAACLRTVQHPKLPAGFDAIMVIGPEHARVFRTAGWSRADLLSRLDELLLMPGSEMVRGAGGIAEGVAPALRDSSLPKFRPGGLLLVQAGGGAGILLHDHRRLGQWPAWESTRHRGGGFVKVLDPTSAARPRGAPPGRSARPLRRSHDRPARHQQAARRRVSRPAGRAARRT